MANGGPANCLRSIAGDSLGSRSYPLDGQTPPHRIRYGYSPSSETVLAYSNSVLYFRKRLDSSVMQRSAMSEPRTRTGPLREGIEYQDLYGVAVLVGWLEHPKRYAWVKFEADEFGSLDDIAACTPGTDLLLIQIKHSISPDLPEAGLSLAEVLHTPSSQTSKRRSLFQKWFSSWRTARDGGQFTSIRAQLLTNRPAAISLLELTSCDPKTGTLNVDPDKVASISSGQWEEFLRQAQNSQEDLRQFLSILELRFDSPEIAVQRTALQIRARNLGITETSYASLESAAKEWAAKRDLPRSGGFIHLDDVRLAAQWAIPRGLNQGFEVPRDFVPARGRLVEHLIDTFRDIRGGTKVVFGSPGAGKSTFLSDLFDKVRQSGVVCIRHHYFLQPKDPDRIKRLTYDRSSEAVLHDLLLMIPDVLPNLNPRPGAFGGILRTSAQSLADQGKTIVLLVDGLDEVIREADACELREFLTQVLPPVRGLWLLFGTRPLSEQRVASLIKRETSEDDWIEVPRFGDEECRRLLESNAEEIQINEHQVDEFTRRFLESTQGHPLHARYMIEALKQICKGGFATASDINRVPAYGSGLSDFYARLWETLTYEAKEVASLLALAAFAVTPPQVVEILAVGGVAPSDLLEAINALRPYINARSQYVELFHSSFQEFVRSTDEYSSTKTVLLARLAEWLEYHAPEPLRWGHLNRIRYFQGDACPLLETVNRQWAVSALADARPFEEIIDQIDWAAHASMERKAFGPAFVFDQLSEYIQQSRQFNDDLWDRIDVMARRVTHGTSLDLVNGRHEIALRSPDFLKEISFDLSKSGQTETLESVFKELNQRIARKGPQTGGAPGDEWWPKARALTIVAALVRIPVPVVAKWAVNFRQTGRSTDLLECYTETLASTRQMTSLQQIATTPLLETFEKEVVEDTAHRVAITKGGIKTEEIIPNQQTTRWSKLHAALTAPGSGSLPSKLPATEDFPNSAKEYDSQEQHVIASRFEQVYLESLLLMIQRRSADLNEWRQKLDKSIWSQEAADALAQLAASNATEFRNEGGSKVDFSAVARLSTVLFPENRAQWSIWRAFHLTLKRILAIFVNLRFTTTARMLDRDIVLKLQTIKQLSPRDIPDIILDVEPPARSPEAVGEFVKTEVTRWDLTVETFPDRAKYYLDLAQLLLEMGDFQEGAQLLRTAILNAIAYGYHKDLAIYESVEAIQGIHEQGSLRARSLLSRLVPIAKWAGDFTDGDETRNLLIDAAKVCQIVCPEVLHAMYVSLSHEEMLYFAEDVFPLLVESLDLSDPFQRAIALTSIDYDSREKLRERADQGDANAASISKALERFAELPMKSDREQGSTSLPYKNSEEPLDLEAIRPEHFSERISSIGPPYTRWDFSMKWFRHHIRKGNERAVYLAVRAHMETDGVYGADGKFLLELVPYADEFEGASAGFNLLCNAATRSYAWSRFFTDEKSVEKIWDTLQDRYPERWLDFVYKTRSVSIYGAPLQKLRSLPASVGTKFLARFRVLGQAEDLAEASVKNIEDLMASLKLPSVDWFTVTRSPLDTLIARLFWISNVVRERAANALANLLQDDSTYRLTLSKMLETLATEELESRVIVLLLPLLRAARAGCIIPLDQVASAVKKPSLVSDQILKEMRMDGQSNAT